MRTRGPRPPTAKTLPSQPKLPEILRQLDPTLADNGNEN
jgi:hypothetical protein